MAQLLEQAYHKKGCLWRAFVRTFVPVLGKQGTGFREQDVVTMPVVVGELPAYPCEDRRTISGDNIRILLITSPRIPRVFILFARRCGYSRNNVMEASIEGGHEKVEHIHIMALCFSASRG
jgi:hypothetical protein